MNSHSSPISFNGNVEDRLRVARAESSERNKNDYYIGNGGFSSSKVSDSEFCSLMSRKNSSSSSMVSPSKRGSCNFAQHLEPPPHHQGKGCPAAICRTFLWLLVCFSVTGGTLAAEPYISPSSCKYPDPVEFALVKPHSTPRGGVYLNGSKANVDCYANFRVKYGDPWLTCVNGEWTGAGGRPVECELIHATGATSCGSYPAIDKGFYAYHPDDASSGASPSNQDGFPVGTELQAACVQTFTLNCTHPHRQLCGRISCQPDGRWVPKDGSLVTSCVAKPVVLTVNGDDDRHSTRSSSSLKNYLILALALVCIFVVGTLTVALLRRPLFCKKREQQQGDGPVVITSSSPNHQNCGSDLDSLPVAMNTGIFLPGAGYDLQDCQMQDVPFVGTTVFKVDLR
ncbi:unnamed protein product [Orchesella dallaii]|uniref:Sushi domain-containing protein n=1 Tax=Orchesella dallaii TaxID=48710 RepID=A0ABP1QU91_9HEXA